MPFTLIWAIFISHAWAGLPHPMKNIVPAANCVIEVTSSFKNKKTESSLFSFKFVKQVECENAAALFRENFSPKDVKKKQVKMKWTGATP